MGRLGCSLGGSTIPLFAYRSGLGSDEMESRVEKYIWRNERGIFYIWTTFRHGPPIKLKFSL